MSLSELRRSLTGAGWLTWGVVLLLLLILGRGLGLGWSWDPLGFKARRIESAEAWSDRAKAEVQARQLEARGHAVQMRGVEQDHQVQRKIEQVTTHALTAAQEAEDATTPLSSDRIKRLRDHDRQLCEARPLATCAPTAGLAGSGGKALRPASTG